MLNLCSLFTAWYSALKMPLICLERVCSPAHQATQKVQVCVTRMKDGIGGFMTFHSGPGVNDYEHQGSLFTSWLSENGWQPNNLEVGEANGCHQHHHLTAMKKIHYWQIGQEERTCRTNYGNSEWERKWKRRQMKDEKLQNFLDQCYFSMLESK